MQSQLSLSQPTAASPPFDQKGTIPCPFIQSTSGLCTIGYQYNVVNLLRHSKNPSEAPKGLYLGVLRNTVQQVANISRNFAILSAQHECFNALPGWSQRLSKQAVDVSQSARRMLDNPQTRSALEQSTSHSDVAPDSANLQRPPKLMFDAVDNASLLALRL